MADPPSLRARLAEIDQEMADVHRELAELQAKLARLGAARKPIFAALQAVFYPVVMLPTEITAEIFTHYVDTAHIGGVGGPIPYAPRWKDDGGHGPLVLASVCRAWRAVALGLQSIWSRIKIFTIPDYLWATENLLKCWLPRAGSHPLTINMLRGSITNDLVAAVAPYSPQWETLACVVSTPAAFPAGELVRGRLPLLKTLNLASGVDDEDLDGTITVFADAPQLRRLRLSGHIVDTVSLPWTQLTHLTLVGQGIDDCLRILQLTMNLETLSVDAAHPLTHPLPIHLPRLHTLKLQHSPESYEILRCLTLPVLNHLELHHLDFSDIVPVTHFLMRSASPLHRLTLHRPELPLVRECLHAATTLRAVCIRDAPWSEGSVTALCTALVHEPGFLPNLRSLVLNPCTTAVELPYADLADMLAARCGGCANGDDDVTLRLETDTPDLARLESCEIVVAPSPEFHDFQEPPDMAEIQRGLDKLRALAADGQKISIRGLHKISSGMVDADAVRPPLHGYMLE